MEAARWVTLKAGPAARRALAEGPLTPARVGAVAAAAGGPKWLAIAAFHRTLFADWLAEASALPVVGSSIGAWAGAMACHERDPAGAIDRLAEGYIAQSYAEKPGARVITDTLAGILNAALTDEVRAGILHNPRFALHVLTVRSRRLAATDNRVRLGVALGLTAAANLVDRVGLGLGFERVVFSRDGQTLSWANEGFATRCVALDSDNCFDALFASGNVPMIMHGVRDPAGAPAGLYRDGGLTDYHIDQPLLAGSADAPIVLMPHFEDRLVPGWLDKRLAWRRPRHADHTLMIGPGPAMREALSDGRVPERRDFYRHAGDDATRQRLWRQAMTAGERMRDAFFELVERDALMDHVEPL
ncbi:patatin-like phospholipase family protein [uncultured Salinisphaera sp.]|uniref:patatin-like phospholipase family protein n=1 Tax=uncultured Salinisphaera sp. TaxID=359372 RepID=UPI0032B21DC7